MPKKNPARRKPYPHPVQTRVDDDLYNRLLRAVNAEGTTVAQYVRRLLINHVPGGV